MNENPGLSRIEYDNKFQNREVGITHPDLSSFIRLRDNGEVEIVAGDVAIVLDPSSRSIIIVADQVKFMTKEYDGIRWNLKGFNPHATTFTEPALVEIPLTDLTQELQGLD